MRSQRLSEYLLHANQASQALRIILFSSQNNLIGGYSIIIPILHEETEA